MTFLAADASPWDFDELRANRFQARNLFPTSLPKYRKALANQVLGGGRCKIALVGDSTFAGLGAGTDAAPGKTAARDRNVSASLAKLFSRAGYSGTADSTFGDAHFFGTPTAALAAQVDTHWTSVGADWSMYSATFSFGGYMYSCLSGTSALVWTPKVGANRFDIYYVQNFGYGQFPVTDASGTLATIDSNGSQIIQKVTVSRTTADLTPVSLQRNGTGGQLRIIGIAAYNSNLPAVEIYNGGSSGALSSDWVATAQVWQPLATLGLIAPDLTIINLGLNDRNTAVSAATYSANMQTIINTAKASGDVIICRYVPPSSAWANSQLEPDYFAALIALSNANQAPLIDMTQRWIDFNTANALGYEADTNVHPTALGYADFAAALFSVAKPL